MLDHNLISKTPAGTLTKRSVTKPQTSIAGQTEKTDSGASMAERTLDFKPSPGSSVRILNRY